VIPRIAILLVAGVGSRLRPWTDDRPKCLIDVAGESILARAVRLLDAAGVERYVVSTGYRERQVRDALVHLRDRVTFVHNPDFAETQNVVSLARALATLRDGESFSKLDGDLVFSSSILDALGATASEGAVAVDTRGSLGVEEMKVVVVDGRIAAFGKQLVPSECAGESIGIECFRSRGALRIREVVASAIASGRTNVYYEDVYNDALEQVDVRPVTVAPDAWTEIDDGADLERARGMFSSARRSI